MLRSENCGMYSEKFIYYYFCLVLLIGGLGYTPWILHSYGIFPSYWFLVFMLIGGASPTFAALIASRLEFGKKGSEQLFSGFSRRGFPKLWFFIPILLPFATASCAILLWLAADGTYALNLARLAEFPPILASNFLMNMWEEIGWRGYALPSLQRKHSALTSSLVVGAFWALWHWPHFAVKNSAMAANYHNFLWFTIATILDSISYTWLYNSTNGSLLIASLYHASTNTVNLILFAEGEISSVIFPYYLLVIAVLALILIILFKPHSLCLGEKVSI